MVVQWLNNIVRSFVVTDYYLLLQYLCPSVIHFIRVCMRLCVCVLVLAATVDRLGDSKDQVLQQWITYSVLSVHIFRDVARPGLGGVVQYVLQVDRPPKRNPSPPRK